VTPRAIAISMLLAALVGAPALHAQPGATTPTTGADFDVADKAKSNQATQLYKAALADFNRDRFAQALEKFRQSYGVVKSPNTRLMIVRSLAGLEHHAEAFREAVTLKAEAEAAAAKSEKYADVVEAAVIELDALAPKLALVLVLVDAPPDAKVTIGGEALPADQWGQPFPVEPGDVEVVLTTAKGEVRDRGTVAIGEQLELALVPDAAPPPPAPTFTPATVSETQSGGYQGPDRKILALAAGSVGVVGMVNFGIFGMLANGQFERLEIRCDGRQCDPDLEEEADKGRTYQTAANVSVGIGAAFLAAGAGLLLWDLLDAEERADAVSLELGPGSATFRGSF
jgi:hypothetical protein